MPTVLTFQPTFGRYHLVKRIAKGGMAEIFRAFALGAEGFRKLVAIKRMLPHLSSDHKFVDMFINEAKIVARLDADNVVRIFDFGSIDEMLFHAMEYVHGRNLLEIIRTLQGLKRWAPLDLACFIFKEALYGLDHAHNQLDRSGKSLGIIHRDLTPANLMVSYDGAVKIADFGIAKAAETRSHTAVGVVRGKVRHMSPEQAQGKLLDQRTDLFSLGTCFYELLALVKAFPDPNEREALRKVGRAEFIPLRQINPAVPKELEAMLHKAMQVRPEDRYASAAEWRDELEKFSFERGFNPSSKTLAGFMSELFGSIIAADQAEMAKELQQLPPAGEGAAEDRGSEDSLRTVLMEAAGKDWPSGLELDISWGTDSRDLFPDEEAGADHLTPYALPRHPGVEAGEIPAAVSPAQQQPLEGQNEAPPGELPFPLRRTQPEIPSMLGTGEKPVASPAHLEEEAVAVPEDVPAVHPVAVVEEPPAGDEPLEWSAEQPALEQSQAPENPAGIEPPPAAVPEEARLDSPLQAHPTVTMPAFEEASAEPLAEPAAGQADKETRSFDERSTLVMPAYSEPEPENADQERPVHGTIPTLVRDDPLNRKRKKKGK